MHILIQVTWFAISLVGISLANLDYCLEVKKGDTYEFQLPGCNRRQITCSDVTSNFMFPSPSYCHDYYSCNELIVTFSNLSAIGSDFLTTNLCYLSYVTLSNCQIEIISEDAFSEFTKMRKLDLEKNKIKTLEFLDYLTDLRSLSLEYNELTEVNAKDFRHLRSLQILNIANNNITSLGNNSYAFENLEEFYLNNNNIVTIQTKVFQKSMKLRILKLDENKIELISAGLFDNLNNLQTLYLQQNLIKSIAPYSFDGLAQLETLDLSGNRFLNAISDNIFTSCDNLRYLNLAFSNISTISYQDFTQHRNPIEILDLSNNNLKSLIHIPDIPIRHLYLQNNPLTLQSNGTSLNVDEVLDLSGCNVTVLNAQFLKIRSIMELKLTNSNLSIIEPNAFQYANVQNKLDLSYNKIQILSSYAFEGLTSLQTLDLSHNPIKLISEFTFSSLSALHTLWITGNNLTVKNNSLAGMRNLQNLNFIDGQHLNLESWGFHYQLRNVYLNLKFINTTIRSLGKEAFYELKSTPEFTLCNQVFDGISLNLSNSSLQFIQPNAFSNLQHSFVNYDLTYNNLTCITANTFQSMSNVNTLQLNHNNILFLDSFAFYKIWFCDTDVYEYYSRYGPRHINCVTKSIYLNDIQNLTQISRNAFTEIHNLKSLHLERSHLTTIEPLAFDTISFDNHVCSGSIYLNFNNITTISNNTFNNIDALTALHLDHSKIETIESNAFAFVTFCDGYEIDVNSGRKYFNEKVENFIRLDNNLIKNLDKETFNGISNLKALHLENNEIKTIEKSAFNGLHMHPDFFNNTINLNENRINQLAEGIFDGIFNLKMLLINHNIISSIEPKAFSHLTDLAFLDLSYNNLSVINPNVFESTALQTLNLSHNKIFTLTAESFTSLDGLTNLILTQNVIEDFPLGTLKNFPLLERLELAHNNLSKFKIGSFSNLAELNYLDLSHNKFKILDESVFYPLHKLNTLQLSYNMLSSMNYTSFLEHLPVLRHISLNDNRWTCKLLLNILKSFKLRYVTYLSPETQRYTEENIDGIACRETDQSFEEHTTPDTIKQIHSESSPEFFNVLIHGLQEIVNENKLNNQNNNSTMMKISQKLFELANSTTANNEQKNSMLNLVSSVKDNSNEMIKLLLEVQKLVNRTSIRNEQESKVPVENNEQKNNMLNLASSVKDNSNEIIKLLLEVQKLVNRTNFRNEPIENNPENLEIIKQNSQILSELQRYLNVTNLNKSQKSSWIEAVHSPNQDKEYLQSNSSAVLYLLLIVAISAIAILCLSGFNTYKKNFKSKLIRDQNQRSEMELIGSN